MKLTKGESVCGGMQRMGCWMALAVVTMLSAGASAQAVSTTTVQGTVYLANGQPGGGSLVVSWPSFTTAAGQAIAADRLTVTIPADGFVSVNLAPNQGATPAGEYYTAVFYMSDGSTNTEYWVVPAAAQATIGQVRAQVMPAAQAVQAVSKAYVDQSISELQQSLLSASGGDLSGPLYLNGDPTQALQAADKHYVDTQVATAVPLSGGQMTGPLTLSSDPTQAMQAADKEYVDVAAANAWPAIVLRADEFAGADFGAKLQACVNAVSASYGGTCDARNFSGNQTMSAGVTISTANTTVLLPCATISTASQIVVTAGTRNGSLRGCALRGGSAASGTQGGTVLAYSGAGAAIQVGDPMYAVDTPGFHLDNVAINTTAATSATALGLAAYRTQEMDVESVYFLGNANQTGMKLDGTGNYTGGTFLDDQFDGFQTAVNAIGHQVANAATTDWMNASSFVRLHIDCPTSNGSPIAGTYGINLQQGDGNTFTGGDVEGCATALHLGANAQNNTIVGLRNENSTNQVVADAGSAYNSWITGGTMFTGQLTDNGTRNSFQDTFHRSFNGLNGDWYGSQQDSTLTNHFRLGIGSGNERGLLNRYQTDYGYRWTMGLSDATGGEQFYQVLDELNNVYRLSVGQYNNGQSSTNNQTAINSAGTGAVVLNGSNNAGTGGVVIGSGGSSATTVATISNSGNAQFNGTLQVGGTAQFAGTPTVRNNADAEVDYYLWPGLTTSQKGSFTYKDWNGNSEWYMVKDASNNWALNSAVGGLDSFKAYQSTNSGDTYVNASNASGAVRVNYESGSGTAFKVYGGNSSTLYASFTGATSIAFPGLAASSGHFCLQVDTSGYMTNTGAACGSGSGTSGTVNSSSAGYIAYYTATGSAIGGMSSVPVTAGGTGATNGSAALANLGGVPVTGGTMTGALNSNYSGTNSFAGTVAAGTSVSKVSPIVNAAGYGLVADGATDIGASVQAALNAAGSTANVLLPCNTSSGCYWANPNTITWPSGTFQLTIQGSINLGTTLSLPTNSQPAIIGDGGTSNWVQFSPAAPYASLSVSFADQGTLGTAVSTTAGTGVSATFTPSVMTGLYAGSEISVVDTLSCSISSVTRTNNVVTATLSGSCHIPPGVPITVAGVSDSSFNGSNSGSGQCPFMSTDSDYGTNTVTWCQTGSNGTSSGGTVAGLNADTVEHVHLTSCTTSTCTATFYRSHLANASWGVVGVFVGNSNGSALLRNLQVQAPGADIVNIGYNANFEYIGAASYCGNPASVPFVDQQASGTNIASSTLAAWCSSWAVQQTNYTFHATAGGSEDNLRITGSWLVRGVEQDHGANILSITNSICDQCSNFIVRFDNQNYYGGWSTLGNNVLLRNVGENDNRLGSPLYEYYQTVPTGINYGTVSLSNVVGFTNTTNNYVSSGVKSDSLEPYGSGAAQGVYGTFDNGAQKDGETRGIQAGMPPAIIPYATANVTQSGWSGACSVGSAVVGPDGTSTAYPLTQNFGQNDSVYYANITPQVGDVVLFGGWAYSPNYGYTALSGGGANYEVSNNGTPHYAFNYGNLTVAAVDANLINDWWHPAIGEAVITSSDGTANVPLQLNILCDNQHTIDYWNPWLIYIPASAGISLAEINRWKTQLLHGYVAPNAAAGSYSVDPYVAAPWSGGGGSYSPAPPYWKSGSTYVLSDGYRVTPPPSSMTWINGNSPCCSSTYGPNGNVILVDDTNNTNLFELQSGSASSAVALKVVSPALTNTNSIATAGPWLFDSTNSKIYGMALVEGTAGSSFVEWIEQLTCTWDGGSDNPTSCVYGNPIPMYLAGVADWRELKLSISSGTLTFSLSVDGGASYQPYITQSGVGTITKGGFFVNAGANPGPTFNVASVLVQ